MTETTIFLSNSLNSNLLPALFASLIWGVFSIILSPCHLSSIPLIIGFLNSQSDKSSKNNFLLTLQFSAGIAISITFIGLTTALLGRIVGDIGLVGNLLFSIILMLFGLFMMDIFPINWATLKLNKFQISGGIQAFIIGIIFGVSLGPCTFAFMAPILGVLFKLSASSTPKAIMMLIAFIIGHCGVIIVSGNAALKVQQYLRWTEKSKFPIYLKRFCGFLVVLGGIYICYKAIIF